MAMLENRRKKNLTALSLVAPFVLVFAVFFLWPTIQMVQMCVHRRPADRGRELGRSGQLRSAAQ